MPKSYLAVAAILCFSFSGPAPGQTNPAPAPHVIVISLDGFPAYALRDPTIPLPVLRKLMLEGAAADGMKPVNPTVTWPNHTAMVTGVGADRHGVIYNGLPVRGGDGKPLRIEPWIPKDELVQARTVYDAAHEAGLTTAEVDWVAVYHAATINWSFGEQPHADGAVEREMINAGIVAEDQIREWGREPITLRDDIWMRAAVHIIEKHKPNLLLLHLLTTDSVQHQYGARTLAANSALILADRQIQRILDAVDRAGIRSQTTIFVVSDHGFKSYHHVIHPNAILREKGLLRGEGAQLDCDAWTVSEGGTAMVYITRESRRADVVPELDEMFQKVPGIAKLIHPADYAQYGYPVVRDGGRMADLVLAASPDYAFDGNTKGDAVADVPAGATPGTHGYLNSDPDMQEILVAWGSGIRVGARVAVVPNVSVAPTLARVLGLHSFQTNAPALVDILRN